jgi:hypothetical protein
MALTPAQLQTLKAAIVADPALNAQPQTTDGAFAIADALNALASPAFRVWRSAVPTKDVKNAIVWTEYISRSVGEKSAFELMISNGVINPSDANIRQGILDIFSGPSAAVTRTNLTEMGKRDATRAEKLFAVGTGSDVSPAALTFEGALGYQDVMAARSVA